MSKSIVNIGNYAFTNCKIASLTLPDSLRTIGEGAFMNNRMAKIDLPDHIESIGKRAFDGQMYATFSVWVNQGTTTEKAAKKYIGKRKKMLSYNT